MNNLFSIISSLPNKGPQQVPKGSTNQHDAMSDSSKKSHPKRGAVSGLHTKQRKGKRKNKNTLLGTISTLDIFGDNRPKDRKADEPLDSGTNESLKEDRARVVSRHPSERPAKEIEGLGTPLEAPSEQGSIDIWVKGEKPLAPMCKVSTSKSESYSELPLFESCHRTNRTSNINSMPSNLYMDDLVFNVKEEQHIPSILIPQIKEEAKKPNQDTNMMLHGEGASPSPFTISSERFWGAYEKNGKRKGKILTRKGAQEIQNQSLIVDLSELGIGMKRDEKSLEKCIEQIIDRSNQMGKVTLCFHLRDNAIFHLSLFQHNHHDWLIVERRIDKERCYFTFAKKKAKRKKIPLVPPKDIDVVFLKGEYINKSAPDLRCQSYQVTLSVYRQETRKTFEIEQTYTGLEKECAVLNYLKNKPHLLSCAIPASWIQKGLFGLQKSQFIPISSPRHTVQKSLLPLCSWELDPSGTWIIGRRTKAQKQPRKRLKTVGVQLGRKRRRRPTNNTQKAVKGSGEVLVYTCIDIDISVNQLVLRDKFIEKYRHGEKIAVVAINPDSELIGITSKQPKNVTFVDTKELFNQADDTVDMELQNIINMTQAEVVKSTAQERSLKRIFAQINQAILDGCKHIFIDDWYSLIHRYEPIESSNKKEEKALLQQHFYSLRNLLKRYNCSLYMTATHLGTTKDGIPKLYKWYLLAILTPKIIQCETQEEIASRRETLKVSYPTKGV